MDSPDRMSWTPSSSAKKRKYTDFIDACVQIRIPGAFPQSPDCQNIFGRDQYLLSPTPASYFVQPGLSPCGRPSMMDSRFIPEPLRRFYKIAANIGARACIASSSAVDTIAGPAGRVFQHCHDNMGPVYAIFESIGNAAKRIKITLRSQPAAPAPHGHPEPSTPPRRIFNLLNRTPTPAFRTQTSILRDVRETGLRKTRKTLRWVEQQQLLGEASDDAIEYQINHAHSHPQTSFEPVMSGALASPPTSEIDTMVFDGTDSATSSPSSYVDSITSSMLEGLDPEDLAGMETREEKKLRKKQEAAAAAAAAAASAPLTRFADELRAINHRSPSPVPLTKQVAFYDSPTHGHPITLIKKYNSEDPLTPPVKSSNEAAEASTRPAIKIRKESRGAVTPASSRDPSHRSQAPLVSPPVTPESIGRDLSGLGFSQRRSSTRLDDLAAQEQLARDLEAAEAAQRAAQEAEERTRLGVRRMPTGPVIHPLSEEWNGKVNKAMRKRPDVEVAKTSVGSIITRTDFGKVLPQRGTSDDPSGWLNDTMVDGYMSLVADHGRKMRGVAKGTLPKVHAFSTYFYTNLSTKGYSSVRRWAMKAKCGGKDLLKMEKIFIPINKGSNHWVLTHVNPQTKTIEYFDSFHHSPGPVFDNIKAWLAAELKEAFVESEWTCVNGKGPRQTNGSDCGVFCTTTAKMIVLGVDPLAFSAADMSTQRRIMLAELLNGEFLG